MKPIEFTSNKEEPHFRLFFGFGRF